MSFNFDGLDERLDWASIQTLTGTAVSISLWLYWDADTASGFQYLFCIQNVDDTARSLYLMSWMNTAVSRAIGFYRIGTTNLQRYTLGNAFPATQWVHILATHDGVITTASSAHIYINGSEVTYAQTLNGATETAPSGKWCLGGRTYSDTVNLDGKLAEIGVWDRVLNSGEIANLAGGHAPSLIPTDLIYYFSGKSNTLVAETGGTGTAAGGAAYNATHPTITYSLASTVITMTPY